MGVKKYRPNYLRVLRSELTDAGILTSEKRSWRDRASDLVGALIIGILLALAWVGLLT